MRQLTCRFLTIHKFGIEVLSRRCQRSKKNNVKPNTYSTGQTSLSNNGLGGRIQICRSCNNQIGIDSICSVIGGNELQNGKHKMQYLFYVANHLTVLLLQGFQEFTSRKSSCNEGISSTYLVSCASHLPTIARQASSIALHSLRLLQMTFCVCNEMTQSTLLGSVAIFCLASKLNLTGQQSLQHQRVHAAAGQVGLKIYVAIINSCLPPILRACRFIVIYAQLIYRRQDTTCIS